jgi:hypothetical protein
VVCRVLREGVKREKTTNCNTISKKFLYFP